METKKENKFYKSYSKLSEIKLVSIKLVQPSRITMWADKVLPGGKIIGEVLNANTVHYKTFKPYKGGLFCQRIFGPLKDFECACNKPTKYKYKKQISNQMSEGHIEIRNELDIKFDKIIKKLNTNYSTKLTGSPTSGSGGKVVSGNISAGLATSSSPPINLSKDGLTATHLKINSFKNTRKYCNTCQVQYTWSIMRRYQLGYIKLVSPVTHVWYLKGFPSYLSILLDMKRKELKSVIYCVQSTTLENILKPKPSLSNPSEIISSWKKIQEKIINQNENTPVQVETLFNGINNPRLINSTNGSAAGSAQSPDLEVGRRWGELSDLAKNKIEKRKKLKINKHKYFPGTFNSLNNYVGGDDFPDSPLKGGLKGGLKGEKDSPTAYSTVNQSKDRFTTFMNSFWRGADNPSKGVITYGHEDLQNKKLNKININDFKKGFIFTKDIEQNPNNNFSNFRVKPDLKQLKKYFGLTDKINLKKLKILSLFIIQLKNQEPHGSPPFRGESGEHGAKMVRPEIKKIFKKMNIPYYILLNININNCSDSHIYNNFINIMWGKFMKTSLKNSLIRLNKILGQLPKTTDSPLIFDGLSGGDMTFASKYLLRTCFQVSCPVSSMDSHDSLVLFKEQKFLGLIIKSFNKLFGRTANDYFKFKFGRTATNLSKYSFIEEFYIKSNFNLELYTLSNFSTKINQFLIADFFGGSHPINSQGDKEVTPLRGLDGKFDLASQPYPPLQGGGKVMLRGAPFKLNKYNSILKNLTKIFFKVFLQNLTLMLAKINTKALKFNLKENQNASISEDFKKNLLKILQRKEKIYNIKFTQNSILYNICFQKNDRANRHRGTQLNITGSKNHRCVPHSTPQNYPFPIIMVNNQITKKELKILTNVFIDWLQRECVLMLDSYSNESFNFGCTSYRYRENLLPSINPWPGAVNPPLGVITYGQKTDLIFKNKIDWYNNHYFMYSSDATYSYFKYYIHNKLNHFIYGVGDLQAPIAKTGSSNIGLVVQPPAKTSLLPPHNPLRGVKSGKSGWEKDGGLNQKDKNNSLFKPGIVPQWISSEVMCTGEHFWDGTTQYGKIKKTWDSLILYPKRKFKRTTSDRWTIYLKRELGAIDINVDDKREFGIWSYAKPPLGGYKGQPTISEYWQKLEQFEKEEIIYKSKIYKKLTNITLSEYYEKREPLEKKKLDNFKKEAGSSNSTIKNKIVGSGYPQSFFSPPFSESRNRDGEKEVLPHLNINNIWESKLYNSHFLWIPIWDAYKDEMLSHLDLDMCFMLPSFSMGISQSSYAPTVNPIHPIHTQGDKGAMRAVSKTYRGGKGNKKFYNRTYIVSHKCPWDLSGWNKFNFLITSPVRNIKKIIPNYKHLFWGGQYTGNSSPGQMGNNMELVDNLNGNRPYVQKDVYLSGAGIIKQLLNEITYTELIKADTQYRLAYSQLDKQINRRINTYYSYKRSEYLIGFTGTEKILGRRIKKLFSERKLILKRLKFIRKFVQKGTLPKQMILTILPVLPPDLRPIIKMGDQIAASDLNRLYQRIIYRNDRLKKFLKDSAISSSNLISFAQRLLQEAVDNLIQNGKTGVISEKDSRGRPLKSLSDIIKGKQGRFRQFLLGKRVDYSGRSVIVVGPKLKLHECGIPKEMALELYLPFLLKKILNENLSKTVIGAKTLIRTNPTLIWELLRELMKTCPVLLNRAPTLHRLGIQAFQPKLIDGRAILLHPLVCSAFNADFDGDQMAVHIPITVEARTEAWKLMLSKNNILSPATGDPLAIPSQDMILGCYYLTTNILNSSNKNPTAVRPAPGVNPPKSEFIEGLQVGAKNKIKKVNNLKGFGFYYTQIKDVLKDYQQNKLELHSSIWLKWQGLVENGKDKQQPIEIRVDIFGNRKEIYKKSHKNYDIKNKLITKYILTTPGKILFNQIINK